MPGVGRGAGEPPEAAWSVLGKRSYRLQYMSRPSRHSALARTIRDFNGRKWASIPSLLMRMQARAKVALDEATKEINSLCIAASQQHITQQQVCLADWL